MKRALFGAALALVFAGPSHVAAAELVDRDIPTQGAASLRINVSGTVHVLPPSGTQVKLHVANFGKAPPLQVTTSKSGSRLTVTVTGPEKSILPFVGQTGYELQVTLPPGMKLDLREFEGSIHIDRITAPAQVYNANGPIVVDDASSALTAEADLGDITVKSARGMVELTCGTGNATATLVPNWGGNLVRMESSKGNLALNVHNPFRAKFDVTSGSGNVSNPLRSSAHAPLVFMLTEDGSVTISPQ